MGNNSIKSNLTKDAIISDIRMTLGADLEKEKVILVVEGSDDVLFFKNKVMENVEIQESFSGKEGVKEIISTFSNERVIGICDKDYENNNSSKYIFYYDYSCLEIMLVMNDDSFSSICNEYYVGELDASSLREKIFVELKWLSVFRKQNSLNGWGVNFSGLSISKSIDKHNDKFNTALAIKGILKINPKLIEEKRFVFSLVRQKYTDNTEQLSEITQGHDFVNYFNYFAEKGKKAAPGSIVISSALRCAYSLSDFKRTKLYSDLTKFSNRIGVGILI